MKTSMRMMRGLSLVAVLTLLGGGTLLAQDDAWERLGAEIKQHRAALQSAAAGEAGQIAPDEVASARGWLEQADDSWKRRNIGIAQMQLNNAITDLDMARAKARSAELSQERKRLMGEVESLERAVRSAEESLQ